MTGHEAPRKVYIGCAGWNVARSNAPDPPAEGSQLQRYASMFRAVEINSSFHRPHRRATYERWAESVPASFRFSVKIPKTITHEKRLVGCHDVVHRFLGESLGLGSNLGPLLVQLPPSLEFDPLVVESFFADLRTGYEGSVVIEPRHKTWFGPDSNRMLQRLGITRVAADPAVIPAAAEPGGNPAIVYLRLHGSPQVYYSSYTAAFLDGLAFRLRAYARADATVWCIFDNTIQGSAALNAQHLTRKIVLEEAAMAAR